MVHGAILESINLTFSGHRKTPNISCYQMLLQFHCVLLVQIKLTMNNVISKLVLNNINHYMMAMYHPKPKSLRTTKIHEIQSLSICASHLEIEVLERILKACMMPRKAIYSRDYIFFSWKPYIQRPNWTFPIRYKTVANP